MRSTNNVRRIVLAALILSMMAPMVAPAQSFEEGVSERQGMMGPMGHPTVSPPFYQETTFLLLAGFGTAVFGFVGLRVVRRRRARKLGPAGFVNEAVLVVDLVNSTHFSTHYGNSLAMRAKSALKDRALEIAEAHGLSFAENTGDGYLMTFSSVAAAVQSAIELLTSLRDQPPELSPGPRVAARIGISYGEILLDSRGARHGAAINKAFRLEGLAPERFARVEGERDPVRIPECDRIFLDEDAAQELRSSRIPLQPVGFCRLKGFSGLHRIFAVLWNKDAQGRSGLPSREDI